MNGARLQQLPCFLNNRLLKLETRLLRLFKQRLFFHTREAVSSRYNNICRQSILWFCRRRGTGSLELPILRRRSGEVGPFCSWLKKFICLCWRCALSTWFSTLSSCLLLSFSRFWDWSPRSFLDFNLFCFSFYILFLVPLTPFLIAESWPLQERHPLHRHFFLFS